MFLDKLLPKLKAEKHRVLIFSQFTIMLDLLETFLSSRDLPFLRLDGSTGRARRNLNIKLFQKPNSEYDIFIISTKAGGLGINLTTADTVVMLDSDW
jgi:SNF2 family DNA or RNA helicase